MLASQAVNQDMGKFYRFKDGPGGWELPLLFVWEVVLGAPRFVRSFFCFYSAELLGSSLDLTQPLIK